MTDKSSAKELFARAYEKQEKELELKMKEVFDLVIHVIHINNMQQNWSLHLLVNSDGTVDNLDSFRGYGMAKTARVLGGYVYIDGVNKIPLVHNFIVQIKNVDMIKTITVTKRKIFIRIEPHEHECPSYHPPA